MAIKTKDQLRTDANALFVNNINGDIEANEVLTQQRDLIDSLAHVNDAGSGSTTGTISITYTQVWQQQVTEPRNFLTTPFFTVFLTNGEYVFVIVEASNTDSFDPLPIGALPNGTYSRRSSPELFQFDITNRSDNSGADVNVDVALGGGDVPATLTIYRKNYILS